MKLAYSVVFERTPNNYSAYVPDVPGCVSTGKTWDEMLAMIREALVFHIEAMLEDGEPLPEPKMSIDDAIAHHSEPHPGGCPRVLRRVPATPFPLLRPRSSWSKSRFQPCNPRPSRVSLASPTA